MYHKRVRPLLHWICIGPEYSVSSDSPPDHPLTSLITAFLAHDIPIFPSELSLAHTFQKTGSRLKLRHRLCGTAPVQRLLLTTFGSPNFHRHHRSPKRPNKKRISRNPATPHAIHPDNCRRREIACSTCNKDEGVRALVGIPLDVPRYPRILSSFTFHNLSPTSITILSKLPIPIDTHSTKLNRLLSHNVCPSASYHPTVPGPSPFQPQRQRLHGHLRQMGCHIQR